MNISGSILLLVGEVFVDVTLTEAGLENKLRLGGIAHAARGLWALGQPFSVAAVLPAYLENVTKAYLRKLGCVEFHNLGEVFGAPNVAIIQDATEVADQGYDMLLREEKLVTLSDLDLSDHPYRDVLIFPGSFDLLSVSRKLPRSASLHLDVAYDLKDPDMLATLPQSIRTVFISTSSPLFLSGIGEQTFEALAHAFSACHESTIILKENRGGTRLQAAGEKTIEHLAAQLGSTINSVGVGDVFAAVFVALYDQGLAEAGWRATYAAAAYSQTTYPDLFKTYVERDLMLSGSDMQLLSGVTLPWDIRQKFSIYLAAPDFTYAERGAIDRVIASLEYHNFRLRRPVIENGELPQGAPSDSLKTAYDADCELLKECSLLFAVPTGRDPGTLVEVGMAMEASLPVVVFDPTGENANTMVMAGARCYSQSLDMCLNAVFQILSEGYKSK